MATKKETPEVVETTEVVEEVKTPKTPKVAADPVPDEGLHGLADY